MLLIVSLGYHRNSTTHNIHIYICVCVCVLLPSNQNQRGGDVTGWKDFRTNVNPLKHDLIVITNVYLGT